MRVLVVDESPERAERLREQLRGLGHEVEVRAALDGVAGCSSEAVVLHPASAACLAEELRALRSELRETRLMLAERKLIERAKGLIMKSRGVDEETAYGLLRKLAMDRKARLAEAAQSIIDAAGLIHGA